MLLPATALASGAGTEVEIGLSLMFAPVALLLLVVQGVVYKVVDSVSARKTVGWVTLVLGVLVGGAELYFIVQAFLRYKPVSWPFPTVGSLVVTLLSLALTATVIYMGWRLRS